MKNLETLINNYLDSCQKQKRLDAKTIKAYRIDLKQFSAGITPNNLDEITLETIEEYIASLHMTFKPKTAKRKIASLKAFYHYLEYKDIIAVNPFYKIHTKFREPVILPKTIPLNTIESLLKTMYKQYENAKTYYQKRNTLRDISVIELLFATGIRISELCAIKESNIDLHEKTLLIYGKNSKERLLQIGNDDVINILQKYKREYQNEINQYSYFFISHSNIPLSDQAVRRMINKYTSLAAIDLHITPHMFRHTFATSLLEADVDIRYIQEMLGHSSINITEIYTHVTLAKQKDILTTKHPRKNINV